MNEKLLSQKEVAKIIGVHSNTIKNWREAKLLSYFRAPGSRRPFYFKNEVEAFIEKNTKGKKIADKTMGRTKKAVSSASVLSTDDWRIE